MAAAALREQSGEDEESTLKFVFGVMISSSSLVYAFIISVTYYQFSLLLSLLKLDAKNLFSINDVNLQALDVLAFTLARTTSWVAILVAAGLALLYFDIRRRKLHFLPHRVLKKALLAYLMILAAILAWNYILAAKRYYSLQTIVSNVSLLVSPTVCPEVDKDHQAVIWRSSTNTIVACLVSRDLVVLSNGQDVVYSLWPIHRKGFTAPELATYFHDVRTRGAFSEPEVERNMEAFKKQFEHHYGRIDKPTGRISQQEFNLLMYNLMAEAHWVKEEDLDEIIRSFGPDAPQKVGGSRLSANFLAGVSVRQAEVGPARIDLAIERVIAAQVRPLCLTKDPKLVAAARTRIRLQLRADGTLLAAPTFEHQFGLENVPPVDFNRYTAEIMSAATRGQPYRLPPEYYDVWKDVTVVVPTLKPCIG